MVRYSFVALLIALCKCADTMRINFVGSSADFELGTTKMFRMLSTKGAGDEVDVPIEGAVFRTTVALCTSQADLFGLESVHFYPILRAQEFLEITDEGARKTFFANIARMLLGDRKNEIFEANSVLSKNTWVGVLEGLAELHQIRMWSVGSTYVIGDPSDMNIQEYVAGTQRVVVYRSARSLTQWDPWTVLVWLLRHLNITSLKISGFALAPKCLFGISKLPLTDLNLSDTFMPAGSLCLLRESGMQLGPLDVFTYTCNTMNEVDAEAIANFGPRKLDLHGCEITEDCLVAFMSSSLQERLEEVDVSGIVLGKTNLYALMNMRIRMLNVSTCYLDSAAICLLQDDYLAICDSITLLDVSGNTDLFPISRSACTTGYHQDLHVLSVLSNLRLASLDLSTCNLPEHGVCELLHRTSTIRNYICTLRLGWGKLDHDDIIAISQLDHLEVLDLQGCTVPPGSMEVFVGCAFVRSKSIRDIKFPCNLSPRDMDAVTKIDLFIY